MEVTEHYQQLFVTSTVSLATQTEIWQSIINNVNVVRVLRRSMEEVKRRWHDLESQTQQKLAANRKEAKATGGGSPVPQEELDKLEEMVATVISVEAVQGVGCPDTARYDLTQQQQEVQSTPPAEQTIHTFSDDEEDPLVICSDTLQRIVDSLRTPPPGAWQPSLFKVTPPPAQTTQQEAHTTTAVSQDQRRVLGCQEKMVDQLRVGFYLMAVKLDAIRGCLSPIRDHLQSLTNSPCPLHALQQSLADIAGAITRTV
ncbi:uncharacterized protein LOC144807825 [Lissotriton helveticus]